MTQPEDLDDLKARVTQMQTANDAALAALGQRGVQIDQASLLAVRLDRLTTALLGNMDAPRRLTWEFGVQEQYTDMLANVQTQADKAIAEAEARAARQRLLEGVNGVNLPPR